VYRGISATIIVDPAEKTVSQIKDRDALEAWLTGTTASPQPESFEDPADLLLKVKQMLEQSTKLQEDAMQLLEEQINSSKQ